MNDIIIRIIIVFLIIDAMIWITSMFNYGLSFWGFIFRYRCFVIGHNWRYNRFMGISKYTRQPYQFTDQRKCLACSKHQETIYPLFLDVWRNVTEPIDNSTFIDMGLKEYWGKKYEW